MLTPEEIDEILNINELAVTLQVGTNSFKALAYFKTIVLRDDTTFASVGDTIELEFYANAKTLKELNINKNTELTLSDANYKYYFKVSRSPAQLYNNWARLYVGGMQRVTL